MVLQTEGAPSSTGLAAIKSVTVIGAGYVGLPICLHLARVGIKVTAVDIDEQVVQDINRRTAKIEEIEDFQRYFQNPEVRLNLCARTTPVPADAFVIAVPTPIKHDEHAPDLSALTAATESIVSCLRPGNLVVVESTVPPFTTERLVKPILERSGYRVGQELMLAHCPERILPGNIMAEAVYNPRVIGGVDRRSADAAAQLYSSFAKGKLDLTSDRTAEFVKLIENTYRDVNIAFANQVALLCARFGIDVGEAIELANQHPRVQILSPGIGVGGHCIPIDPWFLVHEAPRETGLIQAARYLNDSMPQRVAEKILEAVVDLEAPRIVCLGATYKPNVRDMRESPALIVYEALGQSGHDVKLFDPLLAAYACDSVLSVARGADLLVILVPHDLIVTELRFRRQEIMAVMRRPRILAFSPGIL